MNITDPFPGLKQKWASLVVAGLALVTAIGAVFGYDLGAVGKLQEVIQEYGYLVVVALLWFLRQRIVRGR